MIVHAHIKQIIGLVPGIVIHVIIRPGKSVTMDRTLTIVVITGEERVPGSIDEIILGCVTQIYHTQIRVVAGILIDTVVIVSLGTVTIVVVRLTILRPAALCGLELALIEIELRQFIWPDEWFTASVIVIRIHVCRVTFQNLFGGRSVRWILQSFGFGVPARSSVVIIAYECSSYIIWYPIERNDMLGILRSLTRGFDPRIEIRVAQQRSKLLFYTIRAAGRLEERIIKNGILKRCDEILLVARSIECEFIPSSLDARCCCLCLCCYCG
mmetsp:Transcript_4115/g.5982  ORF Transcript_4115/g.5982 Transcript_4115/m.5982 type:complete len:269 (-) Transcript_4115:140-946(-)